MLDLDWKTAGFSLAQVKEVAKKLEKRLDSLKELVSNMDYYDDAASVILPLDGNQARGVEKIAENHKDAGLLVVVGIGGSNLGTIAVQHAVLSMHYNLEGKKIMYADTTDPDATHHIMDEIDRALQSRKSVVINVVSKSGHTAETIANFRVLHNKYSDARRVTFVITTDYGSELQQEAEKYDYVTIGIPNRIGGRYSVFTAVSLFPLALLGINIRRMTEGARLMVDQCLDKNVLKNPALMMACLMYLHRKKGMKIHNQFVFSRDLEAKAKWYRQLLAESIGKSKSSTIIPTVSVGSIDLHSVGQEYIASDLVFHRFITVEKHRHKIKVPKTKEFSKLVPNLSGKSYLEILDAILDGTRAAFKKRKHPYVTVSLPDKSEKTIGALLQMEMIEVMLLGSLLNVNPFDQPAVEEYKKVTKELLKK